MNKEVIKRAISRFLTALMLLVFCLGSSPSSAGDISSPSGSSLPQDTLGQKPKYDYMSTFLSRSTKPLGLKEDLIMKKLLKQPRAIWAIRAGLRHILD
jgi:hypothetical protein